MSKNSRHILSNWPYIFWFAFYFFLSVLIFGASIDSLKVVAVIYAVSLVAAFLPVTEAVVRFFSGVRSLKTSHEKERLIPIFDEVYEKARQTNPHIFKGIRLYINNSMDVNAFAFGKKTLVITRGATELLSDDCLYGIMAHEFGHFSNFDTMVLLVSTVGNIIMSTILKLILWIVNLLHRYAKARYDSNIIKIIYSLIAFIYSAIVFIGDVILMSVSRKHEYLADEFAYRSGYGDELIGVLTELDAIMMSEPKGVMDILRRTHPSLPCRIAKLEAYAESA